jgi:prepilin peptidase CpaA
MGDETDWHGMVWIQTTTLATLLGLAACYDLSERRVPNWLVATFTLVAVGLGVFTHGAPGLWLAAGGFLVGLGMLVIPFTLGFVGAGDVKFFAAVAALVGPRLTVEGFLFGTALGAVAAIATLWRTGSADLDAGREIRARRWMDRSCPRAARAATVPYVVPLGLGTATAVALDWVGLGLLPI